MNLHVFLLTLLLGVLIGVAIGIGVGWEFSAWWNVKLERNRWWTWMKPTFCIREDEKPDWLR
jgi:hypothetical protein